MYAAPTTGDARAVHQQPVAPVAKAGPVADDQLTMTQSTLPQLLEHGPLSHMCLVVVGRPMPPMHARRSDGAFVQLAIDTSTNSLVTVTFVERGRDFRGESVQKLLVSQRLFGDHPHLLKMQVGAARGHAAEFATLSLCSAPLA